MRTSVRLAVAGVLLAFGAQAVAQPGPRPPKPNVVKPTTPPTGVKAGAGAQTGGTKIMSTGAAQKADKGAGSLAPPPPGNAAIKGDAAIKGNVAIKGDAAAKSSPRDPALKGSEKAAVKMNAGGGGAAKQATGGDDGGGDGGLKAGAAMKAQKADRAVGGGAAKGNAAITGNTITGNTISGGAIKGESALGGAGAKVSPSGGAIKGESAGVPAVQR